MKKYIFVGEERSEKAIKMGVTWKDGKLAAKQLFDALEFSKINPQNQIFINLFENFKDQGISDLDIRDKVYNIESFDDRIRWLEIRSKTHTLVGMGKKVQNELDFCHIKHKKIVHPAARGKIRKKKNYLNHIKTQLI